MSGFTDYNKLHPWRGKTAEASKVTRQQIRRELRKTLGDAEGKAEYRRQRGLPEPRRSAQ